MAQIVDKILVSKEPIPEIPEDWKHKHFVEVLFELIQNCETHEWLVDGEVQERIHTFEVEQKSLQVAHFLSKQGCVQKDIVHIVLKNSVLYHSVVFAIWLLGGTVSLADPGLTKDVLEAQIKDTNAKFVICEEGNNQNFQHCEGYKRVFKYFVNALQFYIYYSIFRPKSVFA